MAITTGPKLGLINNASIGEPYYDQLRQFLQGMDQLVQMSVLSASVTVPPTTPNNGDAYLLSQATPSGAWTGWLNYIAVWDTQVTNAGTNTTNPSWVFYAPQAGWLVWVVSLAALMVNNSTSWVPLGLGGTQGESPVGAINGTNRAYALTFAPAPAGSLSLFINGVFQVPGTNYALSAMEITMTAAPNAGSTIYAVYDYA